MAGKIKDLEVRVRASRDRLRAELAELDLLGEVRAGDDVNAAIEILNMRLNEPTSEEEIQRLQNRLFSN
ncbi:hypothetical protein [Sphingopyxis sp.]|uniref:hypothetical protein n=1 Tax=Sphingopyxis sp. TaxID=1908224 RepID=UPI003D6C7E79